jgi:antitoxin PrlF
MQQTSLTIAPNGRVVIPANMRAELGVQSGGKVIARLVNGTLILEPIDAAIRRAQQMVRKYIPDGTGIVDGFIAERHKAAELE